MAGVQTTPWLHLRGLLLLMAASAIVLAVLLVEQLDEVQRMRVAQAELEHAQYGLFDAQVWTDHLALIVKDRVRTMDLGPSNREALVSSFTRVLDTLIREVEVYLRKQNQQGESWWQRVQGRVRQSVQDMLVDFDQLREKAPEYAEAVLAELDKPEARAELSRFLGESLDELADKTFTAVDRSALDAIYAEYECEEPDFCRALLEAKQGQLEERTAAVGLLLVTLVALMLLLAAVDQRRAQPLDRTAWPAVFVLIGATTLMACGVLTPMMEIEARVSELRMSLLGGEILFLDQVLYFQSKSVLDVVLLMMQAGDAASVLVGVLVMSFSVLFPLAKLGAAALLLAGRLRHNAVVRFFALKSSKWSMADVMVVAIIMAYLGFSGLMDSQLGKLDELSASAQVLTTNGTELQPGFYLFFAFCMASLFASSLLEARLAKREAGSTAGGARGKRRQPAPAQSSGS